MLELNKIYCGDCLEIMKEIDDKSIDLIITSPPYPGVKLWGEFYNPDNFNNTHLFLNKVWDECLRTLKEGCKLIINIANTKRRPYLPNTYKIYEWAENKIEALGEIIWHKGYGQLGTAWGSYCNPSDPALADQHEYVIIFRKFGDREKRKGYYLNPKEFKSWRNSIWNIQPESAKKIRHLAPFPIEIPKRLIQLYSYENEIILDPFLGSGTTAVACKQLDRNFIGIEINPDYVEIANKRLANTYRQMELIK